METVHQTEIGSYLFSWRVDRFDSLFDVQQGKQVSKKNRAGDNQRPFLRTKNVLWGNLDLEDLARCTSSKSYEARLPLKSGDLLICEGDIRMIVAASVSAFSSAMKPVRQLK